MSSSRQVESTAQTPGMDAFAGAVANALLQSFSAVQRGSATVSPGTLNSDPNDSAAVQSRDAQRDRSQVTLQSSLSSFQRGSGIRQQSQHKRPRLTFDPPSLFESVRRSRRSTARSRHSEPGAAVSKAIHYSRDIVLLPEEFKTDSGDVVIPHSGK